MSVTIDPDLRTSLDEVAEARGESRSSLVERLLYEGLVEERKVLRQLENPVFSALGMLLARTPGVLEMASTIAGDQMTPEEMSECRALIEEQIARGKERAKSGRTTVPKRSIRSRLA